MDNNFDNTPKDSGTLMQGVRRRGTEYGYKRG